MLTQATSRKKNKTLFTLCLMQDNFISVGIKVYFNFVHLVEIDNANNTAPIQWCNWRRITSKKVKYVYKR